MAYCYQCGVELEAGAERCPLCSTRVPVGAYDASKADFDAGSNPAASPTMAYPDSIHDPVDPYGLSKTERRRMSIELLTVSLLLGAGAMLLADLFFQGRPHWSLYALASIGLVWMIVFPLLAFGRKPAIAFLTIPVSIVLYLVALDWIDGALSWSLTLAIPIAFSLALLTAIVVACSRLTRRKGFNIAAYSFLALAAACATIESIIDLYAGGSVVLAWSVIVGLVLVPLSGMLFYIHSRVMRGSDLRKVFRM